MIIFANVLFGLGCVSLLVMFYYCLRDSLEQEDMKRSTAMLPQAFFLAAIAARYLAS